MRRALIASSLLTALLTGCADPRLEALDQTLESARERADEPDSLNIPELPVYSPVGYHYGARRSPFLAAEAVAQAQGTAPNMSRTGELAPDTSRAQEPLERFALQQLQLVGTLSMGRRHVALIKTPEHDVVSVREGNYMGNNHGRITRIAPQAVSVSERIFTRQDGWKKREAALELSSETSAR